MEKKEPERLRMKSGEQLGTESHVNRKEEFSGFLCGTRVGSNAVIRGVVTYGEKR
jgi:hypothetical protein